MLLQYVAPLTHVQCVQIDPAILGGLVIDIGDRHVDLSVLARLKQVQAAMVESL